jgi:hypothetical protein
MQVSRVLPMSLDYSVTHVPGLYRLSPNVRCSCQSGRHQVDRLSAAYQIPVQGAGGQALCGELQALGGEQSPSEGRVCPSNSWPVRSAAES